MDDIKIIDLFFARSELAIEALDGKYGAICHNLSRSILKDQQDAEECVNDAYLGVWNAIPPHRPNPLSVFVCKIVRNISIMRYRANTALKRNSNYDSTMEELENCLSSSVSVEDSLEEKELIAIIEDFLEEKELIAIIEDFLRDLSQENRVIFLRRYWFSDSYAEIAARTGLTEKNVSVRLSRIRKQLQTHLAERGVLVC